LYFPLSSNLERGAGVRGLRIIPPKENPPFLAGDSHFFVGVYKPNSVSARQGLAEITIYLGPKLL